jgi:hypothetical protein
MEEDIQKTTNMEGDTEEIAKKEENTETWILRGNSVEVIECIMSSMNTCISMIVAIMNSMAAGTSITTNGMGGIR